MTVDDDPAVEQWSKAVDKLVEANDRFKSLPKDHPDTKAAWEADAGSEGRTPTAS